MQNTVYVAVAAPIPQLEQVLEGIDPARLGAALARGPPSFDERDRHGNNDVTQEGADNQRIQE